MPRRNSEIAAKKPRGPGRRFKPGQSGNPQGRKPLPKDYKLALDDLGPRGLQALSDIIADPFHPRHEQACEYVVNRWKGTPTQRVEASGPDGGPIETMSVSKEQALDALRSVVAAKPARAPEAPVPTGPPIEE